MKEEAIRQVFSLILTGRFIRSHIQLGRCALDLENALHEENLSHNFIIAANSAKAI